MSYILVIVYSLSEVKEIEGKMRRAVPKWEAEGTVWCLPNQGR